MNSYLPDPVQLYELERQRHQELVTKAATARLARCAVNQQRDNQRPLAVLWQMARTVIGSAALIARWREQAAVAASQS